MSTKSINLLKQTTLSIVMLLMSLAISGYLYLIIPIIKNGQYNMTGASSLPLSGSSAEGITRQKNDPSMPWSYDFSAYPDGPLNQKDWNIEQGNLIADYNNEEQTYTARSENLRIENGVLVIEAKIEDLNGKKYSSARIDTKGIFDFTYGTLEAEIMLPKGVGTWPAAWLMPSNDRYQAEDYGIAMNDKFRWAMNGEIDFMEAIGSVPNQNLPAAHSYNRFYRPPYLTPGYVNDAYGAFHRYGVVKKANEIIFTIDGMPFARHDKISDNPLEWPFDQSYYLIINLAIGGNWEGVNGVDESQAPWQLKVRSISYKPL